MKKIAILGSTGSIGTQTLEVVRENRDIEVTALAAGSNIGLLEAQIRKFHPVLAAVYSFMFAYAQALAASMQNFGIPSQIVLALPYFMTIAVLLVSGIRGRVKKGAVETA